MAEDSVCGWSLRDGTEIKPAFIFYRHAVGDCVFPEKVACGLPLNEGVTSALVLNGALKRGQSFV
jgi:hypothetical protein